MTCRRINQPGGVQAWGAYLLVQTGSTRVIACSSNTKELIGLPPEEVVWSDVSDMFHEGDELKKLILEVEGTRTLEATPKQAVTRLAKDSEGSDGNSESIMTLAPVYLIIVQGGQGTAIDIEPKTIEDGCLAEDTAEVDKGVEHVEHAVTRQDCRQAIADEVQRLGGYERVMCYMFHEDQHGEVVAEATSQVDVRSYKGLHFPATDIPQRARDLFVLNKARIIVDSSAQPAKLLCITGGSPPIDANSIILSNSTTRAVHPAHLEYLQNWGVKSTLVLSVRVNGKLWGLICCNHEERCRFVSYKARMACARVVDAFAARLTREVDEDLKQEGTRFNDHMERLLEAAFPVLDGEKGKGEFNMARLCDASAKSSLLDVIEGCYGAAIATKDGVMHSIGSVPAPEQLVALGAWRRTSGLEATTCLPKAFSGTVDAPICGMLSAVMINGTILMWFRNECSLEISWTGNPNECKTRIPGSTFLPANSFDTFIETKRGQSATWSTRAIDFASQMASRLDKEWADSSDR